MSSVNVTPEKLMRYAWGYAPPLIMEAAVRNGVFNALSQGPMTAAEVSAATGASERGLASIMNALTGMELLTKDGNVLWGADYYRELFPEPYFKHVRHNESVTPDVALCFDRRDAEYIEKIVRGGHPIKVLIHWLITILHLQMHL